jgi:hypothetical protein
MFQKATPVSKKLKILIYGASGTGKTLAALSFPRPAVVDAENGTDLYAGRAGMPEFSVLRIKTFEELQKAISYIQADKGKSFDTLVIDSVSVFYDVQKEAAAKTAKDNELGYREWAKINNRMVYLYNTLTNLPVHIVCIAREAVEYETKNGNLTKVGTKPDADKRLVYMFDFIIRMTADHGGEVVKSRGAGNIKTMPQVNWQAFAKIADMFTAGQTVLALDEDEAAQRDSVAFADAPHWSTDKTMMGKMYTWAMENLKATPQQVDAAIKANGKALTSLSRDDVKSAVASYLAPIADENTMRTQGRAG